MRPLVSYLILHTSRFPKSTKGRNEENQAVKIEGRTKDELTHKWDSVPKELWISTLRRCMPDGNELQFRYYWGQWDESWDFASKRRGQRRRSRIRLQDLLFEEESIQIGRASTLLCQESRAKLEDQMSQSRRACVFKEWKWLEWVADFVLPYLQLSLLLTQDCPTFLAATELLSHSLSLLLLLAVVNSLSWLSDWDTH